MASLLVLVAHSGRTLQLDVQPSTRVDAVQHALVSFTGIPVADQIAMYQGARLDPAKLLGAYRLPVDTAMAALEDHPVFLYCRSYLKPGAALPPLEALPPLQVQVPPLAEVNLAHPLHSAPSPLVRALPDYERHFQHHLATTRAYWDVAQARLQRCRQLLSEQEVQARAADAARANVEAHYNYILNSYQTFLNKYNAQHAAHATLLATFPSDLAALEAIELHPSLQQQQQQQRSQQPGQEESGPSQHSSQHPGTGNAAPVLPAAAPPAPRRLADLYPVQRLREWAETCNRSHASFGAKVSELEALFQLLRKDVEGLFMQAPSVDLDALGHQMAEHEAMLDEHSSMVQVLSKDLRTVRTLVEDVVRQLGTAAGGGGLRQGALHDAAAAMESIHETHRNRVLPRLAQLDGQLAAFAARVEASKVAMSRDVLSQLQRISGQQSRIRDMKNKLAAFHEVLGRQDAAFAELRVVHRLPSAYRALLAEVVRRSAWHQLYCGQAGRLAEHMARFRDKEAGRRTAFAAQVARYIPSDLLSRAGLATEPPHCQVTVPAPEVPLISVAMADLQRLSYLDERLLAASSSLRASAARAPHSAASSLHHHHQHHAHHHHHHHRASVTDPLASGSQHPQQQQLHSQMGSRMGGAASMAFPGAVAVLDADPPPPMDSLNALEMENARLRAELANHIAAACVRELTAATTSISGAGGGGGEGQQPAGDPAAAAGTPRRARVSGGGVGSATGGGASPPAATAAAAGGSPPQPRRDPAELVAAMQRALGMKDDLIRHQQREMAALAARAASYDERIASLEALLNQRAISDGAGDGSGGGGGAAAGYGLRDPVVEDAAGSPAVAGVCASASSRGQEGAEGRQSGAEEDADTEPAAMLEPGGSDWKGSAAGISEVNKSEGTHGRAANAAGAAVGAVAAQAVQGDLAAAGRAGVEGGPEGESSPDTSHDGRGARPKPPPALSVDVDTNSGRASGAASIVLSPFSLQAAQDQQHLRDGLERTTEADSAGPSALNDGATAAASHGSRAGSGNQPQRGSSGPQAIPLGPGGMRRGAGAAEAEGEEPCVPMAIGSLPFATSLPAGSALASRLASSPSGGGIGLGLALGFGLAALAEGPDQSGSLPREGEGSHRLGSSSGDGESDSSSGGSSGSGSQRASDGGDAELPEGAGARMPDSRERVPGSSSGGASSSGGLQFQPSWPVQASDELATAAAGGGAAAAEAAMDAQQDAAGADGAAVEDVAGACSSAAGGVGAVGSSKEPSAAADGVTLESAPMGGGAVAEAAAEGPGDDADDEGALPDIDELCSDGAWEVASAASAAAGADSSGPQSLGRGASGGSSGGAGGDVGGSGEGLQVCGAEKGAGDGQAAQALEASSGYESVGSAGSAGSDADD